jgi:hypothetical protein
MIEPTPPDIEAEQATLDDETLPELFARMIADAKEVARAEADCLRAGIFRRLVKARSAIFLGIATMLLIQAAVITALVGLVGILSLHVGVAWATVITVAGALIVSAILGRLALNRSARMVNPKKGVPS